jgi:hypothetical protein
MSKMRWLSAQCTHQQGALQSHAGLNVEEAIGAEDHADRAELFAGDLLEARDINVAEEGAVRESEAREAAKDKDTEVGDIDDVLLDQQGTVAEGSAIVKGRDQVLDLRHVWQGVAVAGVVGEDEAAPLELDR